MKRFKKPDNSHRGYTLLLIAIARDRGSEKFVRRDREIWEKL